MAAAHSLFGTDGIRGQAGNYPITPDCALRIGRAFSLVLGGSRRRRVIVGRDTRLSCDMLEAALVAGLNSVGIDTLLAGVVPTPAVAVLARILEADAAISISASHNSFEDNGFKFFGADGYKITLEAESVIEESFLATEDRIFRASGNGIGRSSRVADADLFYVETVLARASQELRLDGITIAIDAANGAACRTTPEALSRLGAHVITFHAEPDGTNINSFCGSTYPRAIVEAVKKTGAQLGIAHDGDADRAVFVDETGSLLDGDDYLAIVGRYLLSHKRLRNNTLVATVLSNFGLDECLQSLGGRLLRANVGDRNVADEMLRNDLNFGGEPSGHFIFRDLSTTGDGLISALQLLQIMSETDKPLSELRRVLTKYPQLQLNVRVTSKPTIDSLDAVRQTIKAAQAELSGHGRVLVRYSGTEPLARILVEGPDAAVVEKHAHAIAAVIRAEIGIE